MGHLKTFFAQVGENLISQISKSSNSRGRPGGGMLKFRIDRYIRLHDILATLSADQFFLSKVEQSFIYIYIYNSYVFG